MAEAEKNQVKNGLFFFMSDFRNFLEQNRMHLCGGFEEIFEKAAQIWEEMTSLERWKYEELARKANESSRNAGTGTSPEKKTNSPSKKYTQMVREHAEAIEYNRTMLLEIENTVRTLDGLALAAYPFYLIHVNCYCSQINGVAIPCELAIVEFNLIDGVRKTYHTIIDPGAIPLGYAFEAEVHSAKSHQIPLPPNSLRGEKDFQRIFKDIRSFLCRVKQYMPPLFTYPAENITIVNNVLCNFQKTIDSSFCPDNNIFRVYPFLNLFYELRNACARFKDEKGFPVLGFAEKELERDDFSFTKGISCKFHEQTEAIQDCSLSQVHRWSYILLNPCCKDLGIDCISGQHFPKKGDLSYWRKILNEAGLLKMTQLSVSTSPTELQDTEVQYNSSPRHVKSHPWNPVNSYDQNSENLVKMSSSHSNDQTKICPFPDCSQKTIHNNFSHSLDLDQSPVKLEKPKVNDSTKIGIPNLLAAKELALSSLNFPVKQFGPKGVSESNLKTLTKESEMHYRYIKTKRQRVRAKKAAGKIKNKQKEAKTELIIHYPSNFKALMDATEEVAERNARQLTTNCTSLHAQATSSKERDVPLANVSSTKYLVSTGKKNVKQNPDSEKSSKKSEDDCGPLTPVRLPKTHPEALSCLLSSKRVDMD